jgi:hypothetical protein
MPYILKKDTKSSCIKKKCKSLDFHSPICIHQQIWITQKPVHICTLVMTLHQTIVNCQNLLSIFTSIWKKSMRNTIKLLLIGIKAKMTTLLLTPIVREEWQKTKRLLYYHCTRTRMLKMLELYRLLKKIVKMHWLTNLS